MAKKEVRHQGRVTALKALFAYTEREEKIDPQSALRHAILQNEEELDKELAQEVFDAAVNNLGKLKTFLKIFAPEFPLEKIAPINRVILFLGIAEIKFMDTPQVVVINEYVDLAKEFGEDKSFAFVNGVLDNFYNKLPKEEIKEKSSS